MTNYPPIRNFVAAAAISPYRLIKFGGTAGTVQHAVAATDLIIGVSTDVSADSAARADVIYSGPAKVEAGGAFAAGDPLTCDDSGRAIKADIAAGGQISIAGYAMEASDGESNIIDMAIARNDVVHRFAANQADTEASDVAGLVTDFNALLDKLKAAGLMTADA